MKRHRRVEGVSLAWIRRMCRGIRRAWLNDPGRLGPFSRRKVRGSQRRASQTDTPPTGSTP